MSLTNPPDNRETPEEREKLLRMLDRRERKIVEDILRDHPDMTAAECTERCRAMGM